MNNILVIGGAGFVGSNLCKALSASHNVSSLDNYFTGSKNNHTGGVKYFEGDSADVQKICGDQDFDTVFHLGEYSRVEESFSDYEIVNQFNISSMFCVMEFCNRQNAKLIYAGSSTKFGDSGENRFASPYALSKYINTLHLTAYANWTGLSYAITYFYNVYGPGEIACGRHSTVIAKFLELRSKGTKTYPVVSPGTQRRNFTYVGDIVDGLIKVANYGSGDGYGIGSPYDYSIVEVVELLGGNCEFLPARPGNRMAAALMTEKTRGLGWSPEMTLERYINDQLLD